MSVSQWTVWLANLDPVVGSEQGRTRPLLVISDTSLNEILPVVNVIPITSRKPNHRVYPNEAFLPARTAHLTLDSIALCYQFRTLDKQRLTQMFGVIEDQAIKRSILEALSFSARDIRLVSSNQ